jgi:D-alanyl-D-alanine carboxypeptidase (penicillin-binding protein 5/6)
MSAWRSHRRPITVVAALVTALLVVALGAPLTVSAAPKLGAPSAILVEPSTGDIVYSRTPSSERAIASTTKMMTALVTLENANLNDTFTTVPYNGLAVESTAGFKGGEKVKVRDLLRALLVASANDAAATLAVRVGGSREKFVAMMNARARKIGLTHTHFANPVGLDAPGNYSSATDLVKMALLLRTNAFIRETVDKPKVTLKSGAKTRTLKNRNTLIGKVPFMNGVKTGHTQSAGYVLVGSGTKKGVTLVSAVLGTASEGARNSDTLALMRYGFKLYQPVTPVRSNAVYARAKVKDSDQMVDLVSRTTVKRVARRGQKVTTKAVVPAELVGPLPAGSRGGTLNVIYDGRVVNKVPLVTTGAVAAVAAESGSNLLVRGVVLLAVVAGTISVVLLRRRAKKRHRRAGAADSEARIA